MTDVEDIVEAVVDIEELLEELAEPEELVEDFVAEPLMIAVGLVAGVSGVLGLLLFMLTLTLLLLAIGPIRILAVLTLLSLLTMALAIGAFLYVRTDIPRDVQRKLNNALAQADDTSTATDGMTEQEAINAIKTQYANGELDDHELDAALEAVLSSDNPERVVENHE